MKNIYKHLCYAATLCLIAFIQLTTLGSCNKGTINLYDETVLQGLQDSVNNTLKRASLYESPAVSTYIEELRQLRTDPQLEKTRAKLKALIGELDKIDLELVDLLSTIEQLIDESAQYKEESAIQEQYEKIAAVQNSKNASTLEEAIRDFEQTLTAVKAKPFIVLTKAKGFNNPSKYGTAQVRSGLRFLLVPNAKVTFAPEGSTTKKVFENTSTETKEYFYYTSTTYSTAFVDSVIYNTEIVNNAQITNERIAIVVPSTSEVDNNIYYYSPNEHVSAKFSDFSYATGAEYLEIPLAPIKQGEGDFKTFTQGTSMDFQRATEGANVYVLYSELQITNYEIIYKTKIEGNTLKIPVSLLQKYKNASNLGYYYTFAEKDGYTSFNRRIRHSSDRRLSQTYDAFGWKIPIR